MIKVDKEAQKPTITNETITWFFPVLHVQTRSQGWKLKQMMCDALTAHDCQGGRAVFMPDVWPLEKATRMIVSIIQQIFDGLPS